MKAVAVQHFGDPGGLAVIEIDPPQPGDGQVLVAVEAIGVGGVDAVIRRGTLNSHGFAPGLILGSEVAGRVTAVGAGVDGSLVGQRVWAFTGVGGGYVEQAVARLQDVTVLPDGLSAIDAVALGSAGPVAHFAWQQAHFVFGESVLVRGAAGSIGISAVQVAVAAGAAHVAVTTSSADRGTRLRALGATEVLDRSGRGAEREYDVVLDVIGGADLPGFLDLLAPNGRMVAVGIVGGPPPTDFGAKLYAAFRRSLSFGTFSLDTVPAADRQRVRSAQFEAAARGEFRAVVHQVRPLHEAADAHRSMDTGEVFGRVILLP